MGKLERFLFRVPFFLLLQLYFSQKSSAQDCQFCSSCTDSVCDLGSCDINFSNQIQEQTCVSVCDSNQYYNQAAVTPGCYQYCDINQIQKDKNKACLQINECPQFTEYGQLNLDGDIRFVYNDFSNNKYTVISGSHIQIYQHDNHELLFFTPQINEANFIYSKLENNKIYLFSDKCDYFVWDYSTGENLISYKFLLDKNCTFYDENSQHLFGYSGTQFYAININSKQITQYTNDYKITQIIAYNDYIFTSDIQNYVKIWSLSDNTTFPGYINTAAYSQKVKQMQIMEISSQIFVVVQLDYLQIPAGGPTIYFGNNSTQSSLQVSQLSKNIEEIVIESNLSRITIYSSNEIVLYSYTSPISFTLISSFNKNIGRYIISNEHAFLVYTNQIQEYDVSGNPNFNLSPINTYQLGQLTVNGIIFDNSASQRVLVFGDDLTIYDYSNQEVIQKIQNFPIQSSSYLDANVTYILYNQVLRQIYAGSLYGKLLLINEIKFGEIYSLLGQPNGPSTSYNKVIKILNNNDNIFSIYDDYTFAVYDIQTQDQNDNLDLSVYFTDSGEYILDMQFYKQDVNFILINSISRLVKLDISSIGSISAIELSYKSNSWNYLYQGPLHFFTVDISDKVYLWDISSLASPVYQYTFTSSEKPVSTVFFDEISQNMIIIGSQTGISNLFIQSGNTLILSKTYSYQNSPIGKPAVNKVLFDSVNSRVTTFHADGITLFWNYGTPAAEKSITFMKAANLVLKLPNEDIFFTTVDFTGYSQLFQWDWEERIFISITKFDRLITYITYSQEFNKLVLGFQDGSVGYQLFEKKISSSQAGFGSLNGFELINEKQVILAYTSILYKYDYVYKDLILQYDTYHTSVITGVKYALNVGGIDYAVTYTQEDSNSFAIWNLDSSSKIGDQSAHHKSIIQQVIILDKISPATVISCQGNGLIVITKLSDGSNINNIPTHMSTVKQIGYFNDILISYDSSQKMIFHNYNDYTDVNTVFQQNTISSIQGFIIDEDQGYLYVYAYKIFIYDMNGQPILIKTLTSGLNSVNPISNVQIKGDYIIINNNEGIMIKDRFSFQDLLNNQISPEYINVQQVLVSLEKQYIITYSQSPNLEEIYIYDLNGNLVNKLLSSSSIFNGKNVIILYDYQNDYILKVGQKSIIIWDLIQGKVVNYLSGENETNNILGAKLDEITNTLITYDMDQLKYWKYEVYIRPNSITIPRKYNIPYDILSTNLYYSDILGNIVNFDTTDYTVKFLKTVYYKPNYLFQINGYIVLDQKQDIVVFSPDFLTSVSLSAQYPQQMFSNQNDSAYFFFINRQNLIFAYTISAGPNFSLIATNNLHASFQVKSCLQNINYNHLICFDYQGNFSVMNYQTSIIYGLYSDHYNQPIQGVYALTNKLVTYSNIIVIYTTYGSSNVDNPVELNMLPTLNLIDHLVYDGSSTIYSVIGQQKVMIRHDLSSIPALSEKKLSTQCKDNPRIFVNIAYDRLIIICDFQINIYYQSTQKFIGFMREPLKIYNYMDLEVVAQDDSDSDNIIDFLLITKDDSLDLYQFSPNKCTSLLSFPLIKTQIYSKSFVYDSATKILDFEILGASSDLIFNYKETIDLKNTDIECTVTIQDDILPILEKKFWNIENSLDKIQKNLETIQINVVHTNQAAYYYSDSFALSDKNVELIHRLSDTPVNQVLKINQYTFANYTLENFQLFNFILDFSNIQDVQVVVSSGIFNMRWINIQIQGNLKGINQYIQGVQQVYIQDLTIDGVQISDSSFFKFEDVDQIIINNLFINNNDLVNCVLIEFINIGEIKINNLQFTGNQMDENTINILKFIQINNIEITQLTINGNIYSGDNQSIFLYFGGVEEYTIFDTTFNNNILFSFLISLNQYDYDEKTITLSSDNQFIQQGIFDGNTCLTSIMQFTGFIIIVQDLQFNNNLCQTCYGSSLQIQRSQYKIKNCSFTQNTALHGGALYIKDNLDIELEDGLERINTIINSNFLNNKALGDGGAIYIDNSDLIFDIIDSMILDNSALIGGGIRYLNYVPSFIQLISSSRRNLESYNYINVVIQDNSAQIFGNNLGSYARNMRVFSEISETNDFIMQVPDTNDSAFLISSYNAGTITSGNKLKLNITFYDEEGYQIIFPNNYQSIGYPSDTVQFLDTFAVQMFSNETNIALEGDIYKSPSSFNQDINGFVIEDMVVHSIPGKSSQFYITSEAVLKIDDSQFSFGQYVIQINMNFRKCKVGEILENSQGILFKCYECPQGKYSIKDPNKEENLYCITCPDSAVNCYASTIILKDGYWRKDNYTDKIEPCSNDMKSCLAQTIDSDKELYGDNVCDEGHIGPLCEECDVYGVFWNQRYKAEGDYECIRCDETFQTAYLIPLTLFLILIIIYIIFSIKVALRLSANISLGKYMRKCQWMSIGTSAVKDHSPFNIKQFMHYLQISQYANTYYYFLPAWLTLIPNLVSIPVEYVMSAFDCTVSTFDAIPVVYLRAVWSYIIPIIYVFVCIIIYGILILFKKIKHSSSYIFNGMTFLMLFLQPGEVKILIEVVSCRTIGGQKYITADLTYECYTLEHIKYIIYVILPGLLVWMIIIPGLIFRGLYKNAQKKKLDSVVVRFKYGFLYQEFKYKYYYWEYVRLYKRLFIVCIHSIYNAQVETKLVLSGLAILFYYVCTWKMKPYQYPRLNNLDAWSMRFLLVLIYLNLVMEQNQIEALKIIVVLFIIFINQGWIVRLFTIIVWHKLLHLYGPKISVFQIYLRKKFPFLKQYISVHKQQNMKVFEHWKIARRLARDLAARRLNQLKKAQIEESEQEELCQDQEQIQMKQEDDNLILYGSNRKESMSNDLLSLKYGEFSSTSRGLLSGNDSLSNANLLSGVKYLQQDKKNELNKFNNEIQNSKYNDKEQNIELNSDEGYIIDSVRDQRGSQIQQNQNKQNDSNIKIEISNNINDNNFKNIQNNENNISDNEIEVIQNYDEQQLQNSIIEQNQQSQAQSKKLDIQVKENEEERLQQSNVQTIKKIKNPFKKKLKPKLRKVSDGVINTEYINNLNIEQNFKEQEKKI